MPLINIFGQERDRQPVVAGSFYPSGSEQLRNELAGFFSSCGIPDHDAHVRAIIVPHAGYQYSGHTAAAGFAAIPADAVYDNIFLIGVSHRYAFEGAAVFTSGNLVTPLGTLQVNRELGEKLLSTNKWFIRKDEVHGPEHSLEVELPFIQYHLKKSPEIVPILLGTHNTVILKAVASGLQPWFNERNLFIISSDFSHYPSYEDACRIDRQTSNAIIKGDPDGFIKTIHSIESSGTENLATAMCGWPAGLVLLYLTSKEGNLYIHNVEYSNSGNSRGGTKNEVVGYNAIVVEDKITETSKNSSSDSFSLTSQEKKTLLRIARNSISARLKGSKIPVVDNAALTEALKEPLGAFVTLTKNGILRGCIGCFTSHDPLWKAASDMALEAAFSDPRFPPLSASELSEIHIEISVLGPMKKINDINEIKLGTNGIYIKKGYRAGTFLPQVAEEQKWNVEQFLSYCARDKAGIGWDGWKDKDTEIFIYEAYVFGE